MTRDSSEAPYRVVETGRSLIFRTPRFTTERGSVLHSDIYNRELTSVLAAVILAGAVYVAATTVIGRTAVSFLTSAVVCVAAYPFFRTYVFRGRYLEVILDRERDCVEIVQSGFAGRTKESFPLGTVVGFTVDSKTTSIGNPDGVAFVERISSQHGMAIPGFAEEMTFHILKMQITGSGDRIIHVGSAVEEVEAARDSMESFVERA